MILGAGKPGELIWHNGGTGGFTSFMAFDSAQEYGLVILNNSDQSVDSLGLYLLDSKNFPYETPVEPLGLFLPFLGVALVSWRLAQPIGSPSGPTRRRWYRPAPLSSQLQCFEVLLELAILGVALYKLGSVPGWDWLLQGGYWAACAAVVVRLATRSPQLPRFGHWGWARWGYHALEVAFSLLLLAFVTFSL